MKFSCKHLVIGSLLFATMGANANQSTPAVMTMDTLQGLGNLKRNMRGDRLRSVDFGNARKTADNFQHMRFRGIDLSDRPLLTQHKQSGNKAISSEQKSQQQTQSADSED